eukprot:2060895-Pleurochrysis_carterae.AAC.2
MSILAQVRRSDTHRLRRRQHEAVAKDNIRVLASLDGLSSGERACQRRESLPMLRSVTRPVCLSVALQLCLARLPPPHAFCLALSLALSSCHRGKFAKTLGSEKKRERGARDGGFEGETEGEGRKEGSEQASEEANKRGIKGENPGEGHQYEIQMPLLGCKKLGRRPSM